MSRQAAHAERVYTNANHSSAAVGSSIIASWRRCMLVHGLAPQKTRAPARLTEGELKFAQEAVGNLVVSASDELDRLLSIVCKAGY